MPRRPECEPGSPEDLYRGAVGAIFRRIRAEREWSLRDFGDRVGVAHTSLYAVERRDATPGIDTLACVAAAVNLSFTSLLGLIIEELTRESSSAAGSLASVVEAATPLTDEQRREVLSFIAFLHFRDSTQSTE